MLKNINHNAKPEFKRILNNKITNEMTKLKNFSTSSHEELSKKEYNKELTAFQKNFSNCKMFFMQMVVLCCSLFFKALIHRGKIEPYAMF